MRLFNYSEYCLKNELFCTFEKPTLSNMAGRPKKESPDEKDERDILLFEEYNKLVKSEGPLARFITKSYFYEAAAKKFGLAEGTARVIIQKMLKKKSYHINVRV
jgi:hypothetical protein